MLALAERGALQCSHEADENSQEESGRGRAGPAAGEETQPEGAERDRAEGRPRTMEKRALTTHIKAADRGSGDTLTECRPF